MQDTLVTAAVSLIVAAIGVWGSGGGRGIRSMKRVREELEVLRLLDPGSDAARRLNEAVNKRVLKYTSSTKERWLRRSEQASTVAGWAFVLFALIDGARAVVTDEAPTELTVWLLLAMGLAVVLVVFATLGGIAWRAIRRTVPALGAHDSPVAGVSETDEPSPPVDPPTERGI